MAMQMLNQMETLYSALADPTRLRLLNLMREGEVCVCFFTEVLGESQPKVSRHLAYLRKSGLVEARREGKWMHYSIKRDENAHRDSVLDKTLEWLNSDNQMLEDLKKLVDVCCANDMPVTIARAPKPESVEALQEESREKYVQEEMETFLL